MKVLVISDSHGHIANLKAITEIAVKSKFSAIIHAGDWNTVEAVKVVASTKIPLYTVLGNADINSLVVDRLQTTARKFGEQVLEIELGGRKIGITHKPSNNKKYFADKKLDLITNGHLHSKYESTEKLIKTIRPGAVVNGINFAVYDTDIGRVDFISENEKV